MLRYPNSKLVYKITILSEFIKKNANFVRLKKEFVMKKITSFIVLGVVVVAGYAQTKPLATGADKKAENPAIAANASAVKWYTMDEVLGLTAKSPKKIFVDVYTDWCGWCKVMDKQTFTNPKIASYLSANFYPVKFNAEQKAPITFGDRTFNYISDGARGVHELAYALMQGKLSYPTTLYMDENGKLLSIVPGYQQPDGLLPILVFFAEDHYSKMSWENFTKDVWPLRQKEIM
jgi:thioredoxin-related protein